MFGKQHWLDTMEDKRRSKRRIQQQADEIIRSQNAIQQYVSIFEQYAEDEYHRVLEALQSKNIKAIGEGNLPGWMGEDELEDIFEKL